MDPSQSHLFSCVVLAQAKMTLSQAQNIFMPVNINCIVLLYKSTYQENNRCFSKGKCCNNFLFPAIC